MPSLTSILPDLAPTFRLTTAALYERQRALVRLGLLPTPHGRGRGSGAEAAPDTIALLTIAILATDNLSDTDGRITQLAAASFQSVRRRACPLTAKRHFAEALAVMLSKDEGPDFAVTVSRSNLTARIIPVVLDSDENPESLFSVPRDILPGLLSVTATLDPLAMREIRQIANRAVEDTS